MVSIIVPIYNVAEWLPQCLQSIKEQTYRDIEVLLIDDGSTDKSGAICDHWVEKDNRFQVRHQYNKGQSAARNAGLDLAKGEFVCFVDSDDILHPDMVKHLVELCGNNDISSCQQLRDEECKWNEETEKIKYYTPQEVIALILYQRKGLDSSFCAKLFRRSLFDNLRFHVGIIYEDLELLPLVFEKTTKEIACSNLKLYFYRQERDGSTMNTYSPRRMDVLNVVDDLELHFSDNPILDRAVRDRKFAAYYNIFGIAKKCGLSESDQANCWNVVKKLRWEVLFNPESRAKNRLGAFIALFGRKITSCFTKILY